MYFSIVLQHGVLLFLATLFSLLSKGHLLSFLTCSASFLISEITQIRHSNISSGRTSIHSFTVLGNCWILLIWKLESSFNSENLSYVIPLIVSVFCFLYSLFWTSCSLISGHVIDPLKVNLFSFSFLFAHCPMLAIADCSFLCLAWSTSIPLIVVYSFFIGVVTNYPNIVALNNRNLLFYSSEDQKSDICLTGLKARCQFLPFWRLWRRIYFLAFF